MKNILPQQPLEPIVVAKEINRLLEEAIKTIKRKSWIEKLLESED